ncbi:hypothetical protein [Micromonospora avicenniae]|uniref:hypothetical protein n=1 Tax=Micromonospora avicenniae TaxID=1198245 RepID=UPI00331A3E06
MTKAEATAEFYRQRDEILALKRADVVAYFLAYFPNRETKGIRSIRLANVIATYNVWGKEIHG